LGLKLRNSFNSIADPVRITNKALQVILIAKFIIKPDDRLATLTIGASCR
jgi:hypothetical protein